MKEDKWALKADAPESAKKAFREFNKMCKELENGEETPTQRVKTNYSIDDFKDRLDSQLGFKIIESPYSKGNKEREKYRKRVLNTWKKRSSPH